MFFPTQNKLTLMIKRFLDLISALLLFAAIAWPLVVIVIGLSIPSDPLQRTTDVDLFLNFKVYPDISAELAAEPADKGELLISGQSIVHINNTSGLRAWYIAAAITEIMGLIALYGLVQMRKLFASLIKGESFANENAGHIEKSGYIFIGWHIILPLLQYFGGREVLKDIAFNVPGIQLNPAFELNIVGIFTGLAILVLAGILREASRIHQEQELTI